MATCPYLPHMHASSWDNKSKMIRGVYCRYCVQVNHWVKLNLLWPNMKEMHSVIPYHDNWCAACTDVLVCINILSVKGAEYTSRPTKPLTYIKRQKDVPFLSRLGTDALHTVQVSADEINNWNDQTYDSEIRNKMFLPETCNLSASIPEWYN